MTATPTLLSALHTKLTQPPPAILQLAPFTEIFRITCHFQSLWVHPTPCSSKQIQTTRKSPKATDNLGAHVMFALPAIRHPRQQTPTPSHSMTFTRVTIPTRRALRLRTSRTPRGKHHWARVASSTQASIPGRTPAHILGLCHQMTVATTPAECADRTHLRFTIPLLSCLATATPIGCVS
jgi:hypothetical protein